jgi:hypothetical protein
MSDIEGQYLYRGTTLGWPGTKSTQMIGTTCTSTDPFVAIHFAIECRNKGEAILLAVRRGKIRELNPNHFAMIESAVNLDISPSRFPAVADVLVDIDQAIQFMHEVGFTDLPVRIRGNTALHDLLKDTYSAEIPRMTAEQVVRFNALLFGEQS